MSYKRKITIVHYILLFMSINAGAQNINVRTEYSKKGKVMVETFLAPSLQGNHGGEDPMRRLTIYLPPGYEKNQQRYPVIYFLHGFLGTDSTEMAFFRFNELMDASILSGRIHPVIFVLPNSDNNFGGSFYTNSTLTGNWGDYIVKDVVGYVDKKYRTIANKNSRGLCGHSMGGNGALKLAMVYPDVFGAVYALSPAVLGWAGEISINNPIFKGMDTFRNQYSRAEIMNDLIREQNVSKFHTKLMAALARAYSPDEEAKTLIAAKMPVRFAGNSMIVDEDTKKKWEANFPVNMIESHLPALKSLNALKIDWGRNEENAHIPITCLQFSKKLEANKVKHFAEEYIGGHVSGLFGMEGRPYMEMLPFFDTYLELETNTKAVSSKPKAVKSSL